MTADELEPGQDELVREDRAASAIVRKARNLNLSTVSSEEQLYTDHKAGDPSALVPGAEQDPSVERKVGSPVRGSFIERVRAGVVRFGDLGRGGRRDRIHKGIRG